METLDGLIEAVSAGLGVALTANPRRTRRQDARLRAGVVFRPVPQLAPLDVWVARREYDQRPDVLAFLDAATDELRVS